MSNKKILHSLLNLIFFKVLSALSVINKGILPLERNSVAIQFFIEVENDDRIETCRIFLAIKKCCLTDSDKEDCDTMDVQGDNIDVIKPRDRRTLVYPYLSLCQHDLVGYCVLVLNYRCPRNQESLDVTIPFDTRIFNRKYSHFLLIRYLSNDKSEVCETLDENSLDNCFPVDCDSKYLGNRPFYDTGVNRCIDAPVCIGDGNKELPNIVYDPDINLCKDLEHPFTIQDIYTINSGVGTVRQELKKEDEIEVNLKSNCSTISQNLCFLKDLMYGKLCPCTNQMTVDFGDGCKTAISTIVLCIISICAVLFSFVFCVNATVWVHKQWSNGNINALMVKVKCKFKRPDDNNRDCHVHSDVRNTLLRDVIVKDIPLELRDSVISICDRMEREVRRKKRYRNEDIGSQISLQKGVTSSESNYSSDSDREQFFK